MDRVGVIAVSYKTDSLVEKFVQQIQGMDEADLVDVFIVNNSAISADDEPFAHVSAQFPRVRLINAPDNPGYFGAAQRVLERINVSSYRWIVVSNVDIEFLDRQFIRKLEKYSHLHEVGVVGPSIISGLTGSESNPFLTNRPSEPRMKFYCYCFSNVLTCWGYHSLSLIASRLKRTFKQRLEDVELSEKPVYAVHGSCMIFSRMYFERGGTFRSGAYMYGEEVFVGETCLRLKMKTIFAPDIKMYHIERVSTGVLYPIKVLRWKAQSSFYLWNEFFRRKL